MLLAHRMNVKKVLKLVLTFDGGKTIDIDPSKPSQTVNIKEGSTFSSSLVFKVNHKVGLLTILRRPS